MTMLERVARAFCDGAGLNWDNMPNSNYDGASGGMVTRLGAMNGSRAAIEAMREPSKAMVDKAWAMIGSNLRYEEVYRHLIDAALKENDSAR